jgi:hypothetical protein
MKKINWKKWKRDCCRDLGELPAMLFVVIASIFISGLLTYYFIEGLLAMSLHLCQSYYL